MRKKVLAAIAIAVLGFLLLYKPWPSDHSPEGAYMRIARAVTDDKPEDAFPYLEEDARWACYTIRDLRKKALDRARTSYPDLERRQLEDAYAEEAAASDGADVLVLVAKKRGWVARLRSDLSGEASVEINGDRATVVTARGTRYPFRRRDNGIWGLTIFTADLVAESERAARDLEIVQKAADDYDRAKK